uniref:Uncharacterized protein n=1 Tax=Panagrolaimus sp. PS1159 TaxID=55785 RepID=A0AC35FQN1_9BILA
MGKKLFYGGLGTVFLIGLFLFIAGWILQYVAFPAILKSQVKKSLVLGRDGDKLNEFANDWLNSKYAVQMQYYIYNYTNSIEMINRGMKPDAIEKGPYTYRQVNEYVYQDFMDNDNLFEYIEENWYYFDANSSCIDCDPYKDFVIMPDLIFNGLFDQLSTLGLDPSMLGPILGIIEIPLIGYKAGPFISNVNDLIMKGYISPLVNMFTQLSNILNDQDIYGGVFKILLESIAETLAEQKDNLNQNNGTTAQTRYYTIKTGKDDYKNVGQVISQRPTLFNETINTIPEEWWNGYNNLTCKNPEYATEFRGTNGDYFAPFIDKDTKLSAYIEDVCRSLDFIYLEESKVGEIDTYRFVIDPLAFNYTIDENCGFCRQLKVDMYGKKAGDFCLPTGLLDASGCKGGAIVFSLPHFLQADKSVQQFFPRAKPDPAKHQTILDIEPTSGTVLAARKRLQINSICGGLPAPYDKVPTGAYPIAWVDNSYYADDDTLKKAKDALVTPKKIVLLVSFIAGVGFGGLLMLIAIIIFIIRKVNIRSRTPSSLASTLNRQAQTMESPPIYRQRSDGDSIVVRRIPRAKVEPEW